MRFSVDGPGFSSGAEIKRRIVEGKGFNPLSDPSLISLIISNLIVIGFALAEHWSLGLLMIVYWAQSVIIGIFNAARILMLKDFDVTGFSINNRPATKTEGTKIFTAGFFVFHYGFFHFIYIIFITVGFVGSFKEISPESFLFALLSIGIFFANHAFSFFYNMKRDSQKVRNIGTLMFFPYARIIPMHITIILGMALGNDFGLILFLALKTAADIIMHAVEHADAA